MSSNASAPLIAVVGQTASGKTALAIQLAERFDGEIICADSRTVYAGMDIGTAKPTKVEQLRVPHYGLDLTIPDQRFTVADYKTYADRTLADIIARGKLPLLVGGSGLYIDAVLYNYQFREPASPDQRRELQQMSVEQLQLKLQDLGLELPENARNPRHLIRAIESNGEPAQRSSLRGNTLLLGVDVEPDILRDRITKRVDAMFEQGIINEAKNLAVQYGWNVEAMQTPGYRAIRGLLEGDLTVQESKAAFVLHDLHLAKRQRTWFKRNKSIHWLTTEDKLAEAVDYATTYLHK